jgi:hypothetical protein
VGDNRIGKLHCRTSFHSPLVGYHQVGAAYQLSSGSSVEIK